MKKDVFVEFYGEQEREADLIAEAKKIWEASGNKLEKLTSIKLFLKPEDDRVYYVFNGTDTGSFPIINTQNDF